MTGGTNCTRHPRGVDIFYILEVQHCMWGALSQLSLLGFISCSFFLCLFLLGVLPFPIHYHVHGPPPQIL